ncbi:hypothetical protein HYALB_00009803 [Hymenoscyphus albidus]|uniref:Xylanolytic transcriptional activator regulatory domain-containing protein n=1 Tax=Hymenoscyphus albidus TaxID=595503 RepID=A0A9N9Q5P3_9HELO|nr:hypothetical protein HYALB_00009803 [Hymenoscyphus albidus]
MALQPISEPNSAPQHVSQRHNDDSYQTYHVLKPLVHRKSHLESQPFAPNITNHIEQARPKIPQYNHFDPIDESFLQLDFSSFLLPPGMNENSNDWYSFDFYSAIRETGNEMEEVLQTGVLDQNLLKQQHSQGNIVHASHDMILGTALGDHAFSRPSHHTTSNNEQKPVTAGITPKQSPSNTTPIDDNWPLMWNPCSTHKILHADPVDIPNGHRLFRTHKTRFDITEQTFARIQAFLKPPTGCESLDTHIGTFTLPSLPVMNVLIGLFFEHFSSQMPVLHHATVDMNTDLPTPLLAAIIIIGATYSGLRNSRRFAIVLIDIVRWHIQVSIEFDNNLMGDNMAIYAQALICYAGLWCGNKRAFEMAESVRANLMIFIRRTGFGCNVPPDTKENDTLPPKSLIELEWERWIAKETRSRLFWVIYYIDLQFPTILNLPATIAIIEIGHLSFPCDNVFWAARSAHEWKRLLGTASIPPTVSFAAAMGPFIVNPLGASVGQRQGLPRMNLNDWGAFLVLLAVSNELFEFCQLSNFLSAFSQSQANETNGVPTNSPDRRRTNPLIMERRTQHIASLNAFSSTYLPVSKPSTHFQRQSRAIHHLSLILLDIPLTTIQGALGTSGPTGIPPAIAKLKAWARDDPYKAENCAFNAVRAIVAFTSEVRPGGTETTPDIIITVFLCHLVIWIFSTLSERPSYKRFMGMVRDGGLGSTVFCRDVLSRVEGLDDELERSERGGMDSKRREEAREKVERRKRKLVLEHGTQVCTRLGTWGAALNVAMLLQKRADMKSEGPGSNEG